MWAAAGAAAIQPELVHVAMGKPVQQRVRAGRG
jgi:UDP-N-acetyl-D-mannosaminuronic acid transferase (WecB/TagA/CpsF family)